MKKIVALMLVLACFFSLMLVSCDKELETLAGKTPEELYTETQEKLAGYTFFKTETTQDITMTMEGQTFTLKQDVVSIMDGENSYFKSYAKNIDGSEIKMEGYYVDGILYNVPNKVYAELDFQDYVTDYLGGKEGESLLLNLPESWFKDVSFTEGDGVYSLVFTISGDKYEEYFSKTGLAATATEISDVAYTVNFNDKGDLVDIVTEFSMTVMGANATVVSKSVVILDGIEHITKPADADSYQKGYLQ